MGVSFYRKGKRRGKEFATMGYGKFNFIRTIYQACWNPEFAFRYYMRDKEQKWSDANPPFPEPMLDLFAQADCEGELSNEQIKAIVKLLSSNETFVQRKPFPRFPKELPIWNGLHDWNNDWMNNPEWRDDAQKFFEMLKDCAKRGCGIEWF